MLTIRTRLLLLSGFVLAHGAVWAQGALRDPTTPPAGVRLPTVPAGSVTEGEASTVAAPASTIRITPVGGRKQAVIDGRPVQAVEQVKQWRVVNITANGVVLKDGRGTRTVPANPSSVSKKPASGAASEK